MTSRWVSGLVCGLGMAACALPAPEGEIGAEQSALNGTVTITGNCDAAEQANLRAAFMLARQLVEDDPEELRACLRRSVTFGLDTTIGGDTPASWPEWVVDRLAEDLPTELMCVDSLGGGVAAGAYPLEGREWIVLTRTTARDAVGALAGRMIHEIAHNKGYMHPSPSALDHFQSVPITLQGCVDSILRGVPSAHGGLVDREWLRFQNEHVEEWLSWVGPDVGQSFETACFGDTIGIGVHGFASDSGLEQIGLTCKPRGVDDADADTQAFGSQLGGAFRQRCYPGEAMVGLWGHADGETVRAVGPMCQSELNLATSWQWNDPQHGASQGLLWQRRCPPGMVVKAVRGRTAGWYTGHVNQLEVVCQSHGNPQHIARWGLPELGGDSGHGYGNRHVCTNRGALSSILTSWDAQGLTRLGGFCASITTDASHVNTAEGINGGVRTVGGLGGSGGEVDYCPSGQAIVAMWVTHGENVDGILPYCVPVAAWSNPAAPVSYVSLAFRGTASETWTWQECPRGYFADGFYTEASDRVNSVGLQCRSFAGPTPHWP